MPNHFRADLEAALGSSFRVIEELRGGSMSRVFLAADERLQRQVVIKVLPPDLATGLSAERFRAEMLHAARLQHPHIVPVLSAGVVAYDGTEAPYYAMPLIQGETLRARIARKAATSTEDARRILLDIVDAVAHAHAMGVVHRDLKPDNVFLLGKNALIADFGVAEALRPTGHERGPSGTGPPLGTPGYMAPEQVSGEPTPDQRADIYSIGALAYELLTGRRPFERDSFPELLLAHATQTPVPPGQLNPAISDGLGAIVMRCLEKRPEDRFQSAHELHDALDRLSSPASPGLIGPSSRAPGARRAFRLVAAALIITLPAIAIMELWHHSSATRPAEPGHLASVALLAPEYFQPEAGANPEVAELVDRVSTDLSRLEGLKVVNYLSVGALYRRGQTPTVAQIGQALGVEHLVVFTPVGDPRGARVAVQLVEAPTQAQVWVTEYAPDSANIEELTAEMVSRVSHALLGPSAGLPIQAHSDRARREGAHAAYLAGMLALRRRTPDGLQEAIRAFEEALRLDSTHVEARGRLATALGLQLSYGYRTTSAGYPTAARALLLAERAVSLDPSHGEPIGFLAYIEYLTLAPLDQVRRDFDRAIKLHASEADVAGWNALMLLREGKAEQSLVESRRALELDPLSSARHLTLALAALGARRYDLALSAARHARETEPDLRRPRQVEGLALLLQGRADQCVGVDLWPHLGVKAMCLHSLGKAQEAQILVDSLGRLAEGEGDANSLYAEGVPAQELATYYAWIGNATKTLQYLSLAFQHSPAGIDLRIVQSGVYDRVRSAPGFQPELQRILAGIWPKVMEQRQRIRDVGESSPF